MSKAYTESSVWLALVAKKIYLNDGNLTTEGPSKTNALIHKIPNSCQFVAFVFKCFGKYLKHLYMGFFIGIWNIGFVKTDIRQVLKAKSLPSVKWLPEAGGLNNNADTFL